MLMHVKIFCTHRCKSSLSTRTLFFHSFYHLICVARRTATKIPYPQSILPVFNHLSSLTPTSDSLPFRLLLVHFLLASDVWGFQSFFLPFIVKIQGGKENIKNSL